MSNEKNKNQKTPTQAPVVDDEKQFLAELFGDAEKLARERAWLSTEVDATVIGVAYIVEQTPVGTGADQRIVPSVVIRCLRDTLGMRNSEIVKVAAGEDIQLLAQYNVAKRVLSTGGLAKGPVLVKITRGDARPHPTKKGQTIRDYDILAWPLDLTAETKHLPQSFKDEMIKAWRAMKPSAVETAREMAELTESATTEAATRSNGAAAATPF